MAWNRESKRHAKAAKGISTRKDTRSSMAQASSNPQIQSAMTDKQYAQEEIEKYKNGHKNKVSIKFRTGGFKTYVEAREYVEKKNIKNASYGYNNKVKHFIEYEEPKTHLQQAREQREMEFKTSNIPTNKKGEFRKNPNVASPNKPYTQADLD